LVVAAFQAATQQPQRIDWTFVLPIGAISCCARVHMHVLLRVLFGGRISGALWVRFGTFWPPPIHILGGRPFTPCLRLPSHFSPFRVFPACGFVLFGQQARHPQFLTQTLFVDDVTHTSIMQCHAMRGGRKRVAGVLRRSHEGHTHSPLPTMICTYGCALDVHGQSSLWLSCASERHNSKH